MLRVLFPSLTGGFKIPISLISIILINLDGCKFTQLYKIQGQEAYLIFPYPCDSTEVTLQHSYRLPFYRSTDGSSLSLSRDEVPRFKVQNRNNTDNCSLEFTISNLLSIDQGTYISSVYKDGEILVEQTHRIWLQVDYPPGKASCLVGEGKGGEWVSIDCTANVGSLSGKIECYQGGEWMPPLTGPTETDTSLKQAILIRKSHSVFCCSSTLDEYKERCECNDTCLYKADDGSNDPCPPLSEITRMSLLSTVTEINQSDYFSTMTSSIPIHTTKCNSNNYVPIVVHSIAVPIEVIVLILSLFFHYKIKTKIRNNNGKDHPIPLESNTSLLNGQNMGNGSRLKTTEFA